MSRSSASSRVFVNAQGGRQGKSGVKEEEKWGTTTSQAEFRSYEPAEMKNARDGPARSQTSSVGSNRSGTQPKVKGTQQRNRFIDESDPNVTCSAYTASEQSASRTLPKLPQGNKESRPASENPIPQRGIDHATQMQHQSQAQQAKHGYFPYRDEFAPRSKRLLYELAHQRIARDSVASGSTASASAFTMSSAAKSGASRSNSEGSLVASSHHSADSQRVPGGVAKRRAQAMFRSPSLWPADQVRFTEMWNKDGCAGLGTNNVKPNFYGTNMNQMVEQNIAMASLLGGCREGDIAAGIKDYK